MGKKRNSAFLTALLNFGINAVLAVAKIAVGTASSSVSLISDGLHSATDTVSSLAVMIGIHLSARESDVKHPYGHERMECVAAVVLAMVIGITGLGIGVRAVTAFMTPAREALMMSYAVLIVPVTAIAVKETMFRYTRRAAKRCGSSALIADAWHQRADALSSVGSLIGVIGAQCGIWWLDAAAGMFIALWIIKAAVEVFLDAVKKMTDHYAGEGLEQELCIFVEQFACIGRAEALKTRLLGNRVVAEITVTVDESLYAVQAYEIAQTVEKAVVEQFDVIKMCSVHIHPTIV